MPNFKSISKTNNWAKLLVGDKMHIKNMVKEFRLTDKRFETEASAIRHYVHLGITAETSTQDLRNSLDNTIIKSSQKEAVRNELKPLANLIENLINKFDENASKNEDSFAELARRAQAIEDRTNTIELKLENGFNGVLNFLKSVFINAQYSLRQIIVLRSIFYVFFLGYKMGKIPPGEENFQLWGRIIKSAHEKANNLSFEELKSITEETVEAEKIQQMASEIFREIMQMPQPKTPVK